MAVTKPMMHRGRGRSGSTEDQDIAYDYRRRIGRWVKEHRLRVDMTQAQLGAVLGYGNTQVSAIEHGQTTPKAEDYATLADLFGLTHTEVGKFFLRNTNPWLYAMIYGERETKLKEELSKMSKETKE